jgi:hypothetical protein
VGWAPTERGGAGVDSLGEGLATALGLALPPADPLGLAAGLALAPADPLGLADGLTVALGLGLALGMGVGVATGVRTPPMPKNTPYARIPTKSATAART